MVDPVEEGRHHTLDLEEAGRRSRLVEVVETVLAGDLRTHLAAAGAGEETGLMVAGRRNHLAGADIDPVEEVLRSRPGVGSHLVDDVDVVAVVERALG